MTTPIPAGNTNAPAQRTSGAASWLCLSAAPAFAVMAWVSTGNAMALCSASGVLPMSDMTSMYLLMSLFHLPPWLDLVFRHGTADRPFCTPTEGD